MESPLRSPLTPTDVAAVRLPVDRASMLPPRVFHDPAVFEFEQAAWFARSWLCVGREEDAARPGEYFLARPAAASVMVVRGEDEILRAFHNVCRHRGSRILTEDAGRVVRFQCPYHAWTYELDGTLRRASHTDELVDFEPEHNGLVPLRLSTWQGFVSFRSIPMHRSSRPASPTSGHTSTSSRSAACVVRAASSTRCVPTGR